MNSIEPFSQWQWMHSSLWGVARGLFVHTLIHPLEVIKIRQQCYPVSEKSVQIAQKVFQEEGVRAFYKGLPPQLLKTSIKQFWSWPMIMELPQVFHQYDLGAMQQQALTGFSIATVDATLMTPLERAKIASASGGKQRFSLSGSYRDGWRGFSAHWTRLSVYWSTFLIAQEALRTHYRQKQGCPLNLFQLAKIGTEIALIVSFVAAPFDIANTLKQAHNLSPVQLLSGKIFRKLYRGWPLSALSLTVHNVASVIVIEKLRK